MRNKWAYVLLMAFAAFVPLKAHAATVIINNPYLFDWAKVVPGDEVRIEPTVPLQAPIMIYGQGTVEKPISITLPNAVVNTSVVFEGAKYVILRGGHLSKTPYSAVIIRSGAKNIRVENVEISYSPLGVWIGNKAGDGHTIINNKIHNNATHGIAVDVINASSTNASHFIGNKIYNNGIHGIELNGSGYLVDGNEVYNNGLKMSGASGIHVYAKDAGEDAGDRNVIVNNISYNNNDTGGQDGNGIQVDRWCDNNVIMNNLSYNNDGAGINVYDSMNTVVKDNVVRGNMRDSGRTHLFKGELVIASEFVSNSDRARNTFVQNNKFYSTRSDVAAINIESTSLDNGNNFGGNKIGSAMGLLVKAGTVSIKNIAEWNEKYHFMADTQLTSAPAISAAKDALSSVKR